MSGDSLLRPGRRMDEGARWDRWTGMLTVDVGCLGLFGNNDLKRKLAAHRRVQTWNGCMGMATPDANAKAKNIRIVEEYLLQKKAYISLSTMPFLVNYSSW